MYRSLLKPLFFFFPPERAHALAINLLSVGLSIPLLNKAIRWLFAYPHPNLPRQLWGLTFPNPVGLAAGFDKDGKYAGAMSAIGFGFIEIGTVTPRPQEGNPLPRLFRLPADEALINRMGFNNEGVDALVERLKHFQRPNGLIIGGNIGKNKDTPNEQALDDYQYCFEQLFDYVDYFVVNVSSPNTPNLRELQDKEPLQKLLLGLQAINQQKAQPKPLLLKIAPDLNEAQLDDIIAIARHTQLAGLIATNTTIRRDGLSTPAHIIEELGAGGLSGHPLTDRATEVIRYIAEQTNGTLPIIGVGGINTPGAAQEKLAAGASLIQLYTGLIYEGPGLVRTINKFLARQPR